MRDRSQSNDRQAGYLGTIEIAPHSRATHVIALREFTAAEGRAYVNPAIVNSIVLTRNPSNRAAEFYLDAHLAGVGSARPVTLTLTASAAMLRSLRLDRRIA